MEKNKITQAFFARYLTQPDDSAEIPATQDAAFLQGILDRLVKRLDDMPLPELNDEERTDMAGKRFPEMQELLFECHDGLVLFPDIAKSIGASPNFFLEVAHQDMSLGGFIKGLQGVVECADTGFLATTARAHQMASEIVERVQADTSPQGPLDPVKRRALTAIFAEALRLQGEAIDAQKAAVDVQTEQAQLAEAQATVEDRKLLTELLQDIGSGATSGRPASPKGK